MLNMSSEAVVITEQGTAIRNTRAANTRTVPESDRWEAERVLGVRELSVVSRWEWQRTQCPSQVLERPAEVAPRSLVRVPMEDNVARAHLRRSDFERWSLSDGCPGCRNQRTGVKGTERGL